MFFVDPPIPLPREGTQCSDKSVPPLIKGADDVSGTGTGLASVFDNLDHDGDIVRRGAFSKSLGSGTRRLPPVWMRNADDPRCYVGDVVEATETDDGLAIKCGFDRRQPTDLANPLTSRRLAAYTSGIAPPPSRSPPWQVPATTRPTALTPARSRRR